MFQRIGESPMGVFPPASLLYLMGGWSGVTGVFGFLANGAAICVFCRARKVQLVILKTLLMFESFSCVHPLTGC